MLQAQAIDTLGILARAIGNDNFRPLAPECIELGKVSLGCWWLMLFFMYFVV